MKTSLGKQLKKFALHKPDAKDKKDHHALAFSDALDHASLDMKDMRNCCDSLLSAAAATTNSAYEFSESLLEMGTCLLERTTLDDSGECGKALSMLGKVQLEMQKLVDGYRSRVIRTITYPSESLLSELRKVEEMKLQCDEKREMYEHIVAQHREKGKSKSGKGESFTLQQLQAAREDYDEVARLCVFRVESLKQGQCRSLLTQAARHHAAQLIFFRKGLKSLEAVEPYIRIVAEKHHIEYQLNEIEDAEDGQVGGNSYHPDDVGELSFDNRDGKQEQENASTSRNSMELDQIDPSSTQTSGLEDIEINLGKKNGEQVLSQKPRVSSHSAPIYPDKFDLPEKIREMQTAVPKFHAYALPTPADARGSTSRSSTSATHSSTTSVNGSNSNLWHSSPIDIEKPRKFLDDMSTASKGQSLVKDSDSHKPSVPLPSPISEGISPPRFDTHNGYDARKVKRQAFSGPLLGKPSTSKPLLSASGPIGSSEVPQIVSGLLSKITTSQTQMPSTLNVPQSVSPPPVSSPKISELHELPRPPGSMAFKPATSSIAGHSAPLINRNREASPTNRSPLLASNAGSPLPPPPLTVPRSFSIPSSSHRAAVMHVAKLLESDIKDKGEGVSSPPLTPISLSSMMSSTAVVPELTPNSGQIRGRS